MLCREHFRDLSEDQAPSCLTGASSLSKLGPLRHCPVDVHVQREGRWGGGAGRWGGRECRLVPSQRAPHSVPVVPSDSPDLQCRWAGRSRPASARKICPAEDSESARPPGAPVFLRPLPSPGLLGLRVLLAEWLTLPGRHISMFKWERG